MARFFRIVPLLGVALLASLAITTTHAAAHGLMYLDPSDVESSGNAASPCAGESDGEGCICTCHVFAESPQLDSSNPTQTLDTYLTPYGITNYRSIILETLKRPPEHSQI